MLFGYFFHQSTDLVVSYHPMKSQSSNDYFGDVILDLRKAIAITTIIETIDRYLSQFWGWVGPGNGACI